MSINSCKFPPPPLLPIDLYTNPKGNLDEPLSPEKLARRLNQSRAICPTCAPESQQAQEKNKPLAARLISPIACKKTLGILQSFDDPENDSIPEKNINVSDSLNQPPAGEKIRGMVQQLVVSHPKNQARLEEINKLCDGLQTFYEIQNPRINVYIKRDLIWHCYSTRATFGNPQETFYVIFHPLFDEKERLLPQFFSSLDPLVQKLSNKEDQTEETAESFQTLKSLMQQISKIDKKILQLIPMNGRKWFSDALDLFKEKLLPNLPPEKSLGSYLKDKVPLSDKRSLIPYLPPKNSVRGYLKDKAPLITHQILTEKELVFLKRVASFFFASGLQPEQFLLNGEEAQTMQFAAGQFNIKNSTLGEKREFTSRFISWVVDPKGLNLGQFTPNERKEFFS